MENFTVYSFRIVGENTPSFNLCHYLSIRSFLERIPNSKYILFINKEPVYSSWWLRLKMEYKDRFNPVKIEEVFSEDSLKKAFSLSCLAHTADYLRLLCLSNEEFKGLFTDLDMICIRNFYDIIYQIYEGKPIYISELDRDNLMDALPNGFVMKINKTDGQDWFKSLLRFYDNYNPDSWSETGIDKPTELFRKDKSQISLISGALFDPFKYCKLDLRDIFLHSRNVDLCYTIHLSESVSSHLMNMVDLEYIMTMNTTLSMVCRDLVKQYWDARLNQSRIGSYE